MHTGDCSPPGQTQVRVDGKFLEVGGVRYLVKGVAYGTFAPDASGSQFPNLTRVAADFAAMAAAGINTVRTYTVPSSAIMDIAAQNNLRVMVGMPWAQHVAFLGDRALAQQIRREAVDTVRQFASHPASLLFAVGNEIPASVVRWHGERRVREFLRGVYEEAKSAAPESLLTYVNFPPTEFLELDFFDVCAFNVYLHREQDLRAYLARLQHVAGHKPLLLAEAGADSIREGLDGQARITAMHLRAAFTEGLCGAVAFSWTDEWWRGGHDVDDWAFGLVGKDRAPKPALAAVRDAFAGAPFGDAPGSLPKVSVVVCAYNAADTIDEALQSLVAQTYPDYEVIVINDGSRDGTGEIAKRYPVRTIDIPNGGLSAARNRGWQEASGEIVAYTDADVRVDRDWLMYLVRPLLTGEYVGSGGPNVVPPDDPWIAQCVARAPGGPTHVLLNDRVAEHVPGCNMAFRREALMAVGGFNPTYLRAGDDVDVCWRLQAKGYRIGFAPSALVWHHHRASVRAYWRQQVGYGEGEIWLDAHHPEKFIRGQMLWRGRIYSPLPFIRSLAGRRLNTGVWGSAAFPSVYSTEVPSAQFLPHTPAWMVISLLLCVSGVLLTPYPALGWALLVAGLLGWGTTIGRCVQFARRSDLSGLPALGNLSVRASRARYRRVIAWLHFIQPIARLYGRLRGMRSPASDPASEHVTRLPWKAPFPRPKDLRGSLRLILGGHAERQFWSETWVDRAVVLSELEGTLRASRPATSVEIDDGWHLDRDCSLGVGRWGRVHLKALVEEHAAGKCVLRVGARLQLSFEGVVRMTALASALVAVTTTAMVLRWPLVSEVTTVFVAATFLRAAWQATRVFALLDGALDRQAASMALLSMDTRGARWTAGFPRPLSAAPIVQAAAVTALVVSTAASVMSLVEIVRSNLPFSTALVVPSPPASPRAVTAGSVAVGSTGDVVFADATRDVIRRLRIRLPGDAVRAAGAVDVLANTSSTAANVAFRDASDIALATNGDVFVADARNHRICRIDRATGRVTTIAGNGEAGFDGDDVQAAQAALDSPDAIAVARNGDLYVADTGNNRIRMVNAATGVITTVAGGGEASGGGFGDGGPATEASLLRPSGLALAANGDLYIADTDHHRIRRVDARTGIISTFAGGSAGDALDVDPAQGDLISPMGLAFVPTSGRLVLYVADLGSGLVRLVMPDGRISTLATARRFVKPSRLAYHPVGWLLVKDGSAQGLTAVRVPTRLTFDVAARRPTGPRKTT